MGVKEISSITASLALVCTGLIAYAPAEVPTQLSSPAVQLASVLDDIVPPGTDPFDWITVVQSIMGYGQSQIGQGLADIAQGDLVAGLSDITRGVNNVVFSPLEDAFLGVLQNAVHQLPVWYVIDDGSLPPPAFPPTDLADLATNLQWMLQTTQSLIANGFDDLGGGVIGGGVGQIVQGLDGIFIKIPESLVLGPLFVALNAVADPGGIPGGPNAVVEAIQDIADRGETQISDGFTDFAQGNVVEGMWNLNSGLSNLLVGVPQNALIATIDTLFGDMVLYPHFEPMIDNWPSLDFSGFLADLQGRFENLLEAFTRGFENLAEGSIHMGVALLARGFDQLLVEIPSELVLGPLTLLLSEL